MNQNKTESVVIQEKGTTINGMRVKIVEDDHTLW